VRFLPKLQENYSRAAILAKSYLLFASDVGIFNYLRQYLF
jgi:hypothetical protein